MFGPAVILATIFLTPLVFLPALVSVFATPKILLFALAVSILVVKSAIGLIHSHKLKLSGSPLRYPLLAFGLLIILNLATHPEARLESLTGPALIYLALTVWAYALTLHNSVHLRLRIVQTFIFSTMLLALHSLFQLTLASHLAFLPSFMSARAFTPTGSPLTTFILILLGTAVSLDLALTSARAMSRSLYTAAGMLHGVALIVLGYLIFPGHELAPLNLPLLASWNVALDALKTLPSFFLGIGLADFPIFYKSVKPLYLNATPLWSALPLTSGSFALQILTTMGLPGLLALAALPLITIKGGLGHAYRPLVILALGSALALLLTPGSLPLLLVFFTTLALLSASPPSSQGISKSWSLILALTLISGSILCIILLSRIFLGELALERATRALARGDGKTVYEQNIAAITALPAMTSYHLSYSQVNLALASSLSQKPGLSETERSQVTQLVSQGVEQAKIATSLRPHDSATWVNLGAVYRNLIHVADGADGFALSAYAQAVLLDPANPSLRVEFGGLLYQLAQENKDEAQQKALYGRAQREFQTAIQLKGDYANSYYNLAKLLESEGDHEGSYLYLQKAISLLGPDSPDLERAMSELATLKSKLPPKPTPSPSPSPSTIDHGSSAIATPSPLPSPLQGGPIDLQ